ncbi:MAG: 4'-phosphopantetheinyl transferase family protein [Lysobacteraceae bacterium]
MHAARFGPVRCAWWPYRRGDHAETRVRAWLGDLWALPPAALAIARDDHGRPYLQAGTHRVDLNWSHSGERLIAACADCTRLGVDIELLRPRPKALATARRYFDPEEAAALSALADDPAALEAAFTRLWCAKEAVLKAHGRGLSFGLEKLRFAVDADGLPRLVACDPALGAPRDWRMEAWTPEPGYWATLAWRANDGHGPARG